MIDTTEFFWVGGALPGSWSMYAKRVHFGIPPTICCCWRGARVCGAGVEKGRVVNELSN